MDLVHPHAAKTMKAEVATFEDKEEATFDFDSELPQGKAYLEVDYKGILNGDMKGFYRTRYTTNWGEERYAATTQFEVGGVGGGLRRWGRGWGGVGGGVMRWGRGWGEEVG